MAETKKPDGPLRSGGGSPNNTMIGEDFMSEWTAGTSTAVDRQVPFPEIKALSLQQFPGQLDLRATLCHLLVFCAWACLCSYIGRRGGIHMFTLAVRPAC
jgi:hypothetical protein